MNVASFCSGRKEMVDFLLQQGANVNHSPNDGNTALIWGAVGGNNQISKVPLMKIYMDLFYFT